MLVVAAIIAMWSMPLFVIESTASFGRVVAAGSEPVHRAPPWYRWSWVPVVSKASPGVTCLSGYVAVHVRDSVLGS